MTSLEMIIVVLMLSCLCIASLVYTVDKYRALRRSEKNYDDLVTIAIATDDYLQKLIITDEELTKQRSELHEDLSVALHNLPVSDLRYEWYGYDR